MLEDLALRYSEFSEGQMRSMGYGLMILGGFLGGLTYRSSAEIRRGTYFALSALIFLCVSAVSFVSMAFIVQALAGGFFWALVALEFLAAVVGGFYLARIAADRSRDAYGHGRMAPLAFIPFANFWLLLTPSKLELSANRTPTIPLLTGGLAVVSGFVMLGAGIGLSAYAQVEGMRRVDEAAAAGRFNVVVLERTLAAMASEVQPPLVVDEVTTLLRVEALGRELRYTYEVEPAQDFLSVEMRLGLLRHNCAYEGLTDVIDAGAVIRHVYQRRDGTEIGVVEVTRSACGR